MNVEGYEIKEDLLYHKEHTWIKKEGEHILIGITDFAQKLAGDITYVDLPSEGDEIIKDKPFGTIETGKWVGKLYGPVDGEVVEINSDVTDDATVINRKPWEAWVLKVKVKNPGQINELLQPGAYANVMRDKLKEIKK
ncbi:MAG: glycine cleavage system H protein [Candidatus Thermoplasmatota archaeon]